MFDPLPQIIKEQVSPPAKLQMNLQRADGQTTRDIPVGGYWTLMAKFTLPAGATEVLIELFAPNQEFTFYGFVEFHNVTSVGSKINNFPSTIKQSKTDGKQQSLFPVSL